MEVRVSSINKAKQDLEKLDLDNIKVIIASSYNNDLENVSSNNKLIMHFDDINKEQVNSFNKELAKKINDFVTDIDFEKYKLYICCDSGISRSSAIAAAILRKYDEDENLIWKDYNFQPNIFVYKTLCDEFKLNNTSFGLKHKENINRRVLKKKISQSRR